MDHLILMIIDSLWQFPIKGLGGESITKTKLYVDKAMPWDRCYAISSGSTKAQITGDGVWLKKAHFLQLMQTEQLANLNCQVDGRYIKIFRKNCLSFRGNLATESDRYRCQQYIADYLKLPEAQKLRIHQSKHVAFTDQFEPLISVGGSASLEAFASVTSTKVDARRFRLNIILQTEDAFLENQWLGKRVRCGTAVIKIVDHVGRCAAINVDPENGCRGDDNLLLMKKSFGHTQLGVFGRVIKRGILCRGDKAILIDDV